MAASVRSGDILLQRQRIVGRNGYNGGLVVSYLLSMAKMQRRRMDEVLPQLVEKE